jgi:predicted TIM-barrel fold metal-dependent hydrolase
VTSYHVPPADAAFDVDCYLGLWAFRPVTCGTVESLLEELDRYGIARALVSPLEGVIYKEPMLANRALAAQVGVAPGRLLPACTLNPALSGWETDFDECAGALGARALRLHPNDHACPLDDPRTVELVRRAAARGLPVLVAVGLEDTRSHHWLMQVPDVRVAEIAALAVAVPEAKVVVTGATSGQLAALWRNGATAPANLWVDIARVQGPIGDVEQLCRRLGEERVLFGTSLPLHEPAAPLLTVQNADLSPGTRLRILHANAAALLG